VGCRWSGVLALICKDGRAFLVYICIHNTDSFCARLSVTFHPLTEETFPFSNSDDDFLFMSLGGPTNPNPKTCRCRRARNHQLTNHYSLHKKSLLLTMQWRGSSRIHSFPP
jgi:hypothetical protein